MIFALFIAKVFLSSGILFGYYWLFLRNKLFHQYNRFYLLVSLVLSVIIPFVNIPVFVTADKPAAGLVYKAIDVLTISASQSQIPIKIEEKQSQAVKAEDILTVLYCLGSLILLFFLFRSMLYIRSIVKKYPCEYVDSLRFYNTREPGTPFSFFNSVFWNEKLDLKSAEGKQIFRHEFFHIKQHHSADILLSEFIIAFLWMNPFFHLIKKELKAIHEFLADEFASSGTDKYSYAELLICQSIKAKKISVAQPFFQTDIKRRIAMITTFKNKDYSYASRLLVLPVAFLLFCAFTLYTKKLPDENAKLILVERKDTPPQDTTKPKNTKLKEDSLDKTYLKVEIESAYPGGAAAWARFLKTSLVYPKEAIEKKIEGMVVVRFVVDTKGYLSNIEAIKGPEELREEAIRVIRESNKWAPAIHNGKLVKSYRHQPINFRLKDANATSFNYYKEGEPGGYHKEESAKLYKEEPTKLYKEEPTKLYEEEPTKLYKEGDPDKTILPKPKKTSTSTDQSDNSKQEEAMDLSFNYSENKNKPAVTPDTKPKKTPAEFEYKWSPNKNNSSNSNIKKVETTPFKYEKENIKNSENKKVGKKYPVEPFEKTYNKVDLSPK